MSETCCEILLAPFWCLILILRPVVSIMLGLVGGTVISAITTVIVFVATLAWMPLHMFKLLWVTATTKECFKGALGNGLRCLVFVCTPVTNMVFLAAITLFSATFGTLYYIGKCTKIVYKNDYCKAASAAQSNLRAEPKSHLGKYLKHCQEFMKEDDRSHFPIYVLKGIWSLPPALVLSSLASNHHAMYVTCLGGPVIIVSISKISI